jgi:dTDP-4-dehydrorhamnose reductase
MRVLITGAGGQLGHDLVACCERNGDDVIAAMRSQIDIGDRDSVLTSVAAASPEVVINTGAWTHVDACESDPDRARRDNGLAVRWLREACDAVGAHLVQISTDYVFDGMLDRPYVEADSPNPQSVYGASKLIGEREAGARSTIVRTSWLCGAVGANMVKTVMRLVGDQSDLAFVDDQLGSPTFTADLAPLVRQLATARQSGLFHVTNQGAVSWFEFVQAIVSAIGADPGLVRPISTADLVPPRPAPRPPNAVLDNAGLHSIGITQLRHYLEPLEELVAVLTE